MYKILFSMILLMFVGCNTKTAESYLYEAELLANQKKYEKANLKLDKAIKINPAFLGAYINRAANNALLGKNETAIKDYQEVLSIDKDNILAYGNIANNYHKMGNYVNAIKYLNKAASIKEKNPIKLNLTAQAKGDDFDIPYNEICFRLGLAYFDADSLNMANQYFYSALENGYTSNQCYYWIGWTYLSGGKTSSACDYFTKAIIHGNQQAESVKRKYCN